MLNFINARFSIPIRLAMVVLLFAAPIGFLMYIFIQQSFSEIAFSQKEAEGARYLGEIWPTFARAAATGEAAQVESAGRARHDALFETSAESKAFIEAKDLAAKMEAGKTLIVAVADNSNLTLDTDLDSFYLMNAETIKMPKITSAALDMASAAAEPTTSRSRAADFAVAVAELKSGISGALSSIAAARKDNAAGITERSLAAPSAALKSAGDDLIVEARALSAGSGDPAKLASARSALLAQTDATWVQVNAELQRLLQARIDNLYHTMTVNLAFAGVFVLAATVLAVTIAGGLARRLAGLLAVMDRLVANDSTTQIPYLSDVNETGKIAGALASFKQTLIERSQLQSENGLMEELAAERRRNEEAREAAMRRQSQVVDAVAEGLGKLARADLTVRVTTPFPEEFERLRVDLNAVAEQLTNAMAEIAETSRSVHVGAADITAALGDLQSRTERQAASVEETAAALEEITATVRKSAEGAKHARVVVSAADENAKRSAAVVGEAIGAMAGISKASEQISPIIGLMDEIAFQTNLLALNAGVEAARAGEAGRGFAVVASEVRALAQRSTEAAKEIKGLISTSTTQVDRGVNLVAETGRSLEQILSQVGEINAIVADMATGANEQATGLGEINVAISQMDQVTQQNAAMVEQSTTACRSLTDEAEHLGELISRFETPSASSDERMKQELRAAAPHAFAKDRGGKIAAKTALATNRGFGSPRRAAG